MHVQALREALSRARDNTQAANRAYKAAWKKDSTAKGFGRVDIALEALQMAEANERFLEAEIFAAEQEELAS